MGGRRLDRINHLLRTELSELIGRSLKDPRLGGLISVTQVEVSADLRHARVFVSVFGSDEERESTLTALRSASGFLRHETAQRVVLRHMPELEFQLDSSIEYGDRVLRLLKQVGTETSDEGAKTKRRRPRPTPSPAEHT